MPHVRGVPIMSPIPSVLHYAGWILESGEKDGIKLVHAMIEFRPTHLYLVSRFEGVEMKLLRRVALHRERVSARPTL